MRPLRYLISALFCLAVATIVLAQDDAGAPKPRFVKFKTDPPGGIIIVDGTTYQTSDSDLVWTKVELAAGTHAVVAKGQAKRLTFDLSVDTKRGTFVTIDFDDDQVWTLLEKAYRSKPISCTVEPDNSTTVTKRKKAADSTAAAANTNEKDTTALKPGGAHVATEVEDSAVAMSIFAPRLKDESKARSITGPAVIKALVNEKGNVVEARIDRSSGSKEFDRAALDAGRKYKFKPATRGGKSVATWVTFPIDYRPPVVTDSTDSPK